MALHPREARTDRARDGRGWSLRNYTALFMVALVAVAVVAALAVRGMAERDARQSAEADASFAAQRASNQLNAALEQIRTLSVPLAADPGLAQVFTDPTKCGIGYAPIV